MKTKNCPACNGEFTKRRKGRCPICKEELYLTATGEIRLMEDKRIVDWIFEFLRDHISKRDGVVYTLETTEYSKERVFAYRLVDRARKFLSLQKERFLSVTEFMVGLFRFILSNQWWAEHLNSLIMLSGQIQTFAKDYYVLCRQEHIRQQAEISRQSQLVGYNVDYDYSAI